MGKLRDVPVARLVEILTRTFLYLIDSSGINYRIKAGVRLLGRDAGAVSREVLAGSL